MAPWELAAQPIAWRDWALAAESAEAEAAEARQKLHGVAGFGG